MDRKQFLTVLAGAPCCAPAQTPPQSQGTSCERKMEFAQRWTKRLFDVLDKQLDEPARVRLMETMGELCYKHAHGSQSPLTLDDFIEKFRKRAGDEHIRREGNIVYFRYYANPAGLKVSDGFCLCPLVETGSANLSGTYCHCSVGYVREMFSGMAGHPVRVELLESLKRGGKTCSFKIHLNRA